MEATFVTQLEDIFKKDPKLVNFFYPSLTPSQFCGYAKIFTGVLIGDVLKILNAPYYGAKPEKIKRLFGFLFTENYPDTEEDFEFKDDKFSKIIKSIIEDKQTPPHVPKIFLSFFNRKENIDSLKNRVNEQTVLSKKHFLGLVGCEYQCKKDVLVEKVIKYLRPETPAKKVSTDKEEKLSKKRKLTGGETKQSKKKKTANVPPVEEKEKVPEIKADGVTPGEVKSEVIEKTTLQFTKVEQLTIQKVTEFSGQQLKKAEFSQKDEEIWKEFKRCHTNKKIQKMDTLREQLKKNAEEFKKLSTEFERLTAELDRMVQLERVSPFIFKEMKEQFIKKVEAQEEYIFITEYDKLENKRMNAASQV